MQDLTQYITKVYAASTIAAKQTTALELIEASHAKSETKLKAKNKVLTIKDPFQIDNFMTNYMLSGEGMKV